MEREKIEYMIEQMKNEKTTSISIEFEDDIYKGLVKEAKEIGVGVEDYVYAITMEKLIEHEKELIIGAYKNVVDIYDFYKINELLETKKEYLVINPSGKHIVLSPFDK